MNTSPTGWELRAQDFVDFANAVLTDAGHPTLPAARVLDFGCGDGSIVAAFAEAGYDAYGTDIELANETDRLRLIKRPYRLPFDDDSFDFVVSTQVLEHVDDHDSAFREIARVLAPGGATLHLFPPRWMPIEPHARVPFATVITARPWLWFWALVGIRNQFQAGKSAREVAVLNREYLHSSTNYLSRSELESIALRWFDDVRFVESLALKHGGARGRGVYPLVARLGVLERLYSATRTRLLLTAKGSSATREADGVKARVAVTSGHPR
jgi:SAM-dependent methyltransferase